MRFEIKNRVILFMFYRACLAVSLVSLLTFDSTMQSKRRVMNYMIIEGSVGALTCNEIGVVELADSISFVPRDAIPEVSVEHREPFFRKYPCVTDVDLKINRIVNGLFQRLKV